MFKRKIWSFFFFLFIISGIAVFPVNASADPAKDNYLVADNCYKKLQNSAALQKKTTEWLNCITRYENIYRLYPDSPWAPAGMYMAAQLNLTLAKLSGNLIHKHQAMDLLARLRNKYPQSAYSGRAKSLLKSIDTFTTIDASPAIEDPGSNQASPSLDVSLPSMDAKGSRVKKSKKRLTLNKAGVKKFLQAEEQPVNVQAGPDETAAENPSVMDPVPSGGTPSLGTPSGDSLITDLRFWSNPEYTRIVVNADHEREYSHRLLNKDPDINKPFQRLYIDIEQTRLGKDVAEHTTIDDNLLKQARAGQYLPHTVRVVVDIKSFENYKIFSLKDPFRIVIDVWGKGSNGGPESLSTPEMAASENSRTPGQISRLTTDNLKSSDIARQLALGVRKIVIDPGHGGSDPGAPGYYDGLWEKDIVLLLAKKLAVTLRNRLQCTVLLTRSTDKKLTLEERTAIANTQRADLFISLHCNAAKNKDLKGIETYILNLATDSQAIAVAARENATSEKNISDLEYILSDLMKHAKIEESTRLAGVVHASFVHSMRKKYPDTVDLGVKQAPFYVLLGARMPSILVETSFISNKTEGKRLQSDAYQTQICNAIADGVEKYINATNPKQL